jgi:outer membrane autotransporter protein
MNHTYRPVFNASLGTWVAVPETARRHGKTKSAKTASAAILSALPFGAHALPTGGTTARSGSTMTARSGFAGALRAGVSATAIVTAMTLAAPPALADGGAGSDGITGTGGSGGAGYSGAAGGNGVGGGGAAGGGGGAAGGGAGGNGATGTLGGAGGTFASPNGSAGVTNAGNFGGGGGGGGWNGNDPAGSPGTGTASISVGLGGSLTGGNGGKGGGANLGAGGGGGAGGYGAIVTGGGASSNAGTISGGTGGASGVGASGAGNGGDGGFGVQFTGAATGAAFTNSGTVSAGIGGFGGFGTGGTGGTGVAFAASGSVVNSGTIAGGAGGSAPGTNGSGGAGITGGDLSITNSGTITGGLSGNSTTRANAIYFSSGANTLTLQAGSTITGNVVVNTGGGASGTLVLGGSTGSSFNNSLIGSQYTGFTTFQKTGTSTWILTGIDAQAWTVSGGMLEVGDSTHAGATVGSVSVGAAGILAGHGTVTGNVANTSGGIVSPGGSIGTLTVGGNYTQGAGSTLAIEVSPTAASQLAVTGTANLAGTLALTYTPGVYSNRSYTIVQAGSVAGTFGTVTGTAPQGGNQSLSYGPTTVTLTLSGITVAPTATSVLGQVGSVALSGAQSANSLLMRHLGAAVWDDGLASASAAAFAPIQVAFDGNVGDLAALLNDAPRAVAFSGGWVRGYGAHSSVDGSGNSTGYRTSDGGFLAGYDRELSQDVKLGLAAGYGRSTLRSQDGASARLDSPRVMAYGSRQTGPWAVDAAVGYAADTIDTARPLPTGTATATHRAHEFTAEAQIRAGLDIGGVNVVPAAGLRYVRVAERGYTETGAGGNNLSVDGRSVESTQPFVGLSAARAFTAASGMVWTPRAELEYAQELNHLSGANVSVGGGTFTAAGAVPSRDRVTAGLGLSGKLRDDLRCDVSYRVTLPTGNYLQHAVSASLRYRF